ncbi:hypothetical protein [Alteribacillus sp. HJP-4]
MKDPHDSHNNLFWTLDTLFGNHSDAICMLNTDGELLYENQKAASMFGFA